MPEQPMPHGDGETAAPFYTNHFYVHVNPLATRISFWEKIPGIDAPVFRTSILMTTDGLQQMIELLARLTNEIENRKRLEEAPVTVQN